MNINTKIRYGLRVMIELALSENPILQKEIAIRHNLSNKFLDQITSNLKAEGLIKNYKGKGSGYVLNKPSNKITIFDIFKAFDSLSIIHCLDNDNDCIFSNSCHAQTFWFEYRKNIIDFLKNKTLNELINQ